MQRWTPTSSFGGALLTTALLATNAAASDAHAATATAASSSAPSSGGAPSEDGDPFVIPAGSEPLVQRALGLGVVLGGGCLLGDTRVDRARIDASYRCAGVAEPVHVFLTHAHGPTGTVVTPERGGGPEALLEAIRARVAVEPIPWQARKSAAPSPAPAHAPSPTSGGYVRFVGWLPVLALAFGALPFLSRRRAPLPSLGHGFATCVATLLGLHALGDAIVLASAHLVAATAMRVGWMLLAVLLLLVATFLFRRTPRTARDRWLALAFAALTLAGHYALALRAVRAQERAVPTLAGVPAARPSGVHDEPYPGRPRVSYAVGAHGFRGPDWSTARAPGTVRVALLGDSFVYGSGVEQADTLAEKLATTLRARHPERTFEVLNLGVPGTNLPSHVDMYEAAKTLDPSAIVLCTTLPNDLSDAGGAAEHKARTGITRYSFATAVLGPPLTSWVSGVDKLATEFDTRALAVLERETGRLSGLRAAAPAGARVPLFVFTFGTDERRVTEAFARVPGAIVIDPVPTEPAYYIPGDGHPTAEGNRVFATHIAEALEHSSVLAR
jgi:hypothetical protein